MSQLIFKFPFKTNYYDQDFYVSSNNFSTYKLIESWPNWPDKWINIYGPSGCGKTHLSNILKRKINSLLINAQNFKNSELVKIENYECIILDSYQNNIDEDLLYTLLNHSKQLNKYIVFNSLEPLSNMTVKLSDLKSRFKNFIEVGVELPTDELLRVIISKSFSERQINLNNRNLEFIIKNIDRSYDKVFQFIKKIDNESLSTGKSININLIKKVLNK
jgi:chromosomal replication initiation ATPase DnaA|tara:strand:- start:19 stop:672 length:654 start_codon:yes stop_codon:yes gene_type:complete